MAKFLEPGRPSHLVVPHRRLADAYGGQEARRKPNEAGRSVERDGPGERDRLGRPAARPAQPPLSLPLQRRPPGGTPGAATRFRGLAKKWLGRLPGGKFVEQGRPARLPFPHRRLADDYGGKEVRKKPKRAKVEQTRN